MTRSFTLLHLSDLHFGQAKSGVQHFEQTLVVKELMLDCQRMAAKLGAPDVILVTGDIAFSAKSEQYGTAQKWLKELATAVGVGPDRVWVVPGNHDVDRGQVTNSKIRTSVHADLRANPNNLDEFLLPGSLDDFQSSLWPKFTPFSTFSQGWASPPLTATSAFWTAPLQAAIGHVQILGINTSLLSLDATDAKEKLALGAGQRHALLHDLPNGRLVLALMHHPPEWLSDGEELTKELVKHPHLLLSGHVHAPGGGILHALGGRALLRVDAGASNAAAGEDARHSYSWIQLSSAGLSWYPRCYTPRQAVFKADSERLEDGQIYQSLGLETLPTPLKTWLSRVHVEAPIPHKTYSSPAVVRTAKAERALPGVDRTTAGRLSTLQLRFSPVGDNAWQVQLFREYQPCPPMRWNAPDPTRSDYGSQLFKALFPIDHRPEPDEQYHLELVLAGGDWKKSPLATLEWVRLAHSDTGYPLTDTGWTLVEPVEPPFSGVMSGRILVIESTVEAGPGPWTEGLRAGLYTHVHGTTLQTVLDASPASFPEHAVWVVADSVSAEKSRRRLQAAAKNAGCVLMVWCNDPAPDCEQFAQVQLLSPRERGAVLPRRKEPGPDAARRDIPSLLPWLQRFLLNLRREVDCQLERSFARACRGLSEDQRAGLRLRGAPSRLTLQSPDPRVGLDLIFQWYLELDRARQERHLNKRLQQGLLSPHHPKTVHVVIVPGPTGSAPEAFLERTFQPLKDSDVHVHAVRAEWSHQPNEQIKAVWRCLGAHDNLSFVSRLRELASDEDGLVLKVLHGPASTVSGTSRHKRTPDQLLHFIQCLNPLVGLLRKEDRSLRLLIFIPLEHPLADRPNLQSIQERSGEDLEVTVLESLSLCVPKGEILDWFTENDVPLPTSDEAKEKLLEHLASLHYEALIKALDAHFPNARKR